MSYWPTLRLCCTAPCTVPVQCTVLTSLPCLIQWPEVCQTEDSAKLQLSTNPLLTWWYYLVSKLDIVWRAPAVLQWSSCRPCSSDVRVLTHPAKVSKVQCQSCNLWLAQSLVLSFRMTLWHSRAHVSHEEPHPRPGGRHHLRADHGVADVGAGLRRGDDEGPGRGLRQEVPAAHHQAGVPQAECRQWRDISYWWDFYRKDKHKTSSDLDVGNKTRTKQRKIGFAMSGSFQFIYHTSINWFWGNKENSWLSCFSNLKSCKLIRK